MVQIVTSHDKQREDFEASRDTYYELLDKGKEALESMIEVARESEHPRAYEVLSGMIKNISDVNDRLMDLNKKQKDLEKNELKQGVENQQNNFYLGSTADIQRLLQHEEIIDNESSDDGSE